MKNRFTRKRTGPASAALMLFCLMANASLCATIHAAERVTYLVLAETVEPIMIVRDGDPMAGGLMTEIVQLIFDNSDYIIEPMVLPWQRMKMEFKNRDDWIVHGFPQSFDPDSQSELSELPIFPFNHSAVTLKDSGLTIRSLEDLRGHVVILIENFQYPGLEEYLAGMNDDNAGTTIGILRAFTPGGALEMLKHGRGDVVIEWQARAIYNLPAAGLKYQDVEFHDATSIVPTKNMHLVFSARQSDEFRNYVNSSIKTLRDSGQLHELVKEYYFPALPPNF